MDEILKSDIIFWNGPLGVIEHEIYKKGSEQTVLRQASNLPESKISVPLIKPINEIRYKNGNTRRSLLMVVVIRGVSFRTHRHSYA